MPRPISYAVFCLKKKIVPRVFASWCNGSTRDSGSLCLGSSPSEAATQKDLSVSRGKNPCEGAVFYALINLSRQLVAQVCSTPPARSLSEFVIPVLSRPRSEL